MWTFFFEYSISILRSLFKNGRFIFAMPISILRWVLKNRHSSPCLEKYWYWHTWSNSILILSFLLKTNNMPISILGFKWPIAIFFFTMPILILRWVLKNRHSHPFLEKYWYWHTWSNSILILRYSYEFNVAFQKWYLFCLYRYWHGPQPTPVPVAAFEQPCLAHLMVTVFIFITKPTNFQVLLRHDGGGMTSLPPPRSRVAPGRLQFLVFFRNQPVCWK